MAKKYELLHQEISVSPFTMGIVHRGFHNKLQLKYTKPLYFKNSVVVYKDMKVDWYGDYDNFRKLGYKIIDNTKKDLKFRDNLLKHTKQIGNELFKENKKIDKTNLSKFTNKQLASAIKKTYYLGNDLCDVGMVAAAPDVTFSNFSKLLKDIISKSINKNNLKKNINEYFNVLTNSGKGTLITKENFVLLTLAREINSNINLKKLFKQKSGDQILEVLKTKYNDAFVKLNRIKNNYCWLAFGQLGPAKDIEDYVLDIKNLLVENKIDSEIKSIKEEGHLLKQEQTKLFSELKLTKEGKELFKTAQNFSYNKAYRYDMLLYAYYILDKILREVSKRVDLSVTQMRFCTPEEIAKFLQGQKLIPRKEIEERQELCVAVVERNGIKHLSGEKAKKYIKQNIKELKIKKDVTTIHGSSAYLGRVTGRVKIINGVKDLNKVENGDILVAIQTTPDLLPAMNKAAAFVTDIGGITSHAAIVAREMKKPCIIGTKFASKALKDGDIVEVNANEGDIMKLK